MRKGILFVIIAVLSGLSVTTLTFARQNQAPAANALTLECARVLFNGAIQHSGINQGCGYGTWEKQHINVDWITSTSSSLIVNWTTWQPAGSSVCVRPISYYENGAAKHFTALQCGNGNFSQTVATGSGGVVTLEVWLMISQGFSGLPAITSMWTP